MPDSSPQGPKLVIWGPLTLKRKGEPDKTISKLTIAPQNGGLSFREWGTSEEDGKDLSLGDSWTFTGGSRVRFIDQGGNVGFDVPLHGSAKSAGASQIKCQLNRVDLTFVLPGLTSTFNYEITLTQQCAANDFADACCSNTWPEDKKLAANILNAILKTLQGSGSFSSISAPALLGVRSIRWAFPLFYKDLASYQVKRLWFEPKNGNGLAQFALSPDGDTSFNSGASAFSLVATARWDSLDSGDPGDPEVAIEAAWDPGADWLPAEEPPAGSPSLQRVLFRANQRAADSRQALEQVAGGQPESFLPQIDPIVNQPRLPAVLFWKQRCPMKGGVIELPDGDPGTRSVVSVLSSIDDRSKAQGDRVIATLSLPGLGSQKTFCVELEHDPGCLELEPSTGDPIASFRLVRREPENAEKNSSPAWSTRLGALGFEATAQGGLATDPEHGSSMSRLVITRPRRDAATTGSPPVGVEWHLRLAVGRVTPEGVDRPWGDREDRRLPLVVPQWREQAASATADAPSQPPFVLVVDESVGPQQDRWVRATLLENSNDQGTDHEVSTLLSFEPWSVLRFTRRRLERLGDAENAAVAIFDGDQRTWRVKQAAPEYAFEFPPQGIGESADKPGMLEIHDLSTATERWFKQDILRSEGGKNIIVVRPVPTKSPGGSDVSTDGIERSFVIETRLTPSLDLWVKPSDLDRNYILPEWQAHEILRRRNDFGLGVALRALRGEFLYGLSVGVDTSREAGPAVLARVAEIEALTGKLPPLVLNPSPSPIQSPLVRRWRALRRALLGRSERIELWTPAYDQIRPFVHARFEKGATFALRSTALLRPPLADPAVAAAPSDPADGAITTADVRPGSPRFATHGLPGGALWPLESSGVLDELIGRPAATGGTIERIAISPGGGDADQAVEFADGHVTIASQTRAGFLQRQKIEVLGRIGVFWHRAKHVIVYERTVNPSEQFAPVADDAGWHKTRSRRAILRKVSEYIEILQPTRSYPDTGPDAGSECGFLDSVRFNTRIIHVDGSWKTEWAEDVKSKKPAGYKIPLWNAGAAEQRPNVYPLPSVSAVTLGEGKEKRPLVPRQIANPENLCFYTQMAPPKAATTGPCDPDSWEPFFGVDYGILVDPATLERLIAPGGDRYGGAENEPDETFARGRKPSTPRVLPGHHRFTWRLLPDGKRTTLNAGVDGAPVYGDLDSITFSRGSADNGDALAAEKAARLQAAATDPAILLHDLGELVAAPGETLKDSATLFCGRVAPLIAELKTQRDNLGKCPLDCEKLKSLLDDAISKKRRLIQAIFRDWALTASRWTAEEIKRLAGSFDKDAKKIVAELLGVRQMVDGLLDDVQTGIGSIRADIAAIRRAVTDCIAALRSQLARTTARFEAALDAAERDVAATGDWSARIYADTRALVIAEVDSLAEEIKAEADETLRRIAIESTPLGTPIVRGLKVALDEFLINQKEQLKKGVTENLPEQLPTAAFNLKENLAACRTAIDSLIGKIDQLGSELLKQLDTPDGVLNSPNTNLFEPIQKYREAASKFLADTGDTGLVQKICEGLSIDWKAPDYVTHLRESVSAKLHQLADTISLDGKAGDWLAGIVDAGKRELNKEAADACEQAAEWAEGIIPSEEDLKKLRDALLPDGVDKAISAIEGAGGDIDKIKAAVKAAEMEFRTWKTTVDDSGDVAIAYKARVSEALGNIDRGGLKPGNVLALVSAATQAPEIGQMQANIDRMRCSYKKAKIETSKAMASLSKLGAALKALGIEMPFDGLGEQLELDGKAFEEFQKKFDLQRLLPDFGGIKLDGLLEGVKLPETPAEFREAVKLRHDFDKVHFRAWAQVDVNMPIKGRKKLFGIGPMTMYFRESLLTGSVRAEASKESADASTTGSGLIETNIDVDVSGELLVSLEQVRIEYSKEKKLHVDFDPKRIRLHSAMQFVQDTFGNLIGDEIGGLTIVKEKGIPVGLEHQFKLPVMSLMAGTSGISNIQMSNAFRLVAYPDFVISNRFCLSRPELPFLFTFFILGGTGYVIVDSRYRPLDRALTVEVEAAIGGAAALGIATGAISGQVFITFSVALAYRKTFTGGAATGDGLSVAAVLVVAGNVNIAGIIDVYIGVMLRLTYREGGAIDGVGTVTVTVKISVFFTFKFRSEMTLKMRGGRAETTRKIETSATPGAAVSRVQDKAKLLRDKAEQLQNTRA